MITKGLSLLSVNFLQILNDRPCPDCGAAMTESQRCRENESLFVWYRCSQNDCDGQWLQKMPAKNLK